MARVEAPGERATSSLPESEMVDISSIDTTWALVHALPARQRAAIALRSVRSWKTTHLTIRESESRHAWLASALQASAAGAYTDAYDSGSSIGSTHCARQAGGSHGSPK